MRETNPWNGIYYSIGPHDMFPIDYELFNNSLAAGAAADAASYTERPSDLWVASASRAST